MTSVASKRFLAFLVRSNLFEMMMVLSAIGLILTTVVLSSGSQHSGLQLSTSDKHKCDTTRGGYYAENPDSCRFYFICDSAGNLYDGDCGEYGSFDEATVSCQLATRVRCSRSGRNLDDDDFEEGADEFDTEEEEDIYEDETEEAEDTESSDTLDTEATTSTTASMPISSTPSSTASPSTTNEEYTMTTSGTSLGSSPTAMTSEKTTTLASSSSQATPAYTTEPDTDKPITLDTADDVMSSTETTTKATTTTSDATSSTEEVNKEETTKETAANAQNSMDEAPTKDVEEDHVEAEDKEAVVNEDDLLYDDYLEKFEESLKLEEEERAKLEEEERAEAAAVYPQNFCIGKEDGSYLNADSIYEGCHEYAACVGGDLTVQRCPEDMTFDARDKKCVIAYYNTDLACTPTTPLKGYEILHANLALSACAEEKNLCHARGFCAGKSQVKHLTLEEDCFRFYLCHPGLEDATLLDCPAETVYLAERQNCVGWDTLKAGPFKSLPRYQRCREEYVRRVEERSLCPQASSAEAASGEGEVVKMRLNGSCSKYLMCTVSSRVGVVNTCPYPTVFDEAKGTCQHYTDVEGCKHWYYEG